MGAFIIGREAALAYASGPETIITTKFNRIAWTEGRKHYLTVPPAYLMERYTPGIMWMRGVFGNWYDSTDAIPPVPGTEGVPSGTVGTLTITPVSGKTIAVPVLITELQWDISMADGGPPQLYQYGFVASATVASGAGGFIDHS